MNIFSYLKDATKLYLFIVPVLCGWKIKNYICCSYYVSLGQHCFNQNMKMSFTLTKKKKQNKTKSGNKTEDITKLLINGFWSQGTIFPKRSVKSIKLQKTLSLGYCWGLSGWGGIQPESTPASKVLGLSCFLSLMVGTWCLLECEIVQPLWITIWNFLRKLNIELPVESAIPFLDIYLRKMKCSLRQHIY